MNARQLTTLAPLYVAWNSANKRARATYNAAQHVEETTYAERQRESSRLYYKRKASK